MWKHRHGLEDEFNLRLALTKEFQIMRGIKCMNTKLILNKIILGVTQHLGKILHEGKSIRHVEHVYRYSVC